jgi:hypothetical protein
MRWLVVMLALAGLGLLQGGHCHDAPATAIARASVSGAHDVAASSFVAAGADAALTVAPAHDHGSAGAAMTAEDCKPPVSAAVAATTATGAPLPLVLRSSYLRFRPTPAPGRVLPAPALAALGVLRA